jgi:SAM-dependent MidA family methyltransferase
MSKETPMRRALRNMLVHGDLSFRDFVEVVLYHPELGYYSRPQSPVGKNGDYVTSPTLSPVFAFTLSRLVREFMSRAGDDMCTIVDIGCGDGGLIHALGCGWRLVGGGKSQSPPAASHHPPPRFIGVDRSLDRVKPEHRNGVTYVQTVDEIPRGGAHLIISNELFDAIPFARLVMRGGHLHELYVDASFDWSEQEAPGPYEHYFEERGIELADGQFADVSLEWEAMYRDIAKIVERGLIVTFDYGYPEEKLFHSRARRFGTAAAYANHQVTRDLLANPGEQDITAHINFSDLIRAGESLGFHTRFFDVQAKFLLALGITEHELFTPVTDLTIATAREGVSLLESRDEARRLILPDGIGHDIRVLAQSKQVGEDAWSYERVLF